jgi:hypothetical protein
VEILLVAVGVLVLFTLYATWTAGRLDRLHARVDAAWSLLDARLVRRSAAALSLADTLAESPDSAAVAEAAAELGTAARAELAAADADARTAASAERGSAWGAIPPGEQDARIVAENGLVRALRAVPLPPDDPAMAEVRSATELLGLAKQVYDDIVRDTRALRLRRLPRALRLAGHRPMPHYFDVDEVDVAPYPPATGTDEGGQPGAAVS